jgi:phosphatidylserine/phosphatidylglycerophosphate/cardiolipin synthase-like enzyme
VTADRCGDPVVRGGPNNADIAVSSWFLTPDERGNPATEIDRRRGETGAAHTDGNEVRVLVHGVADFARRLEDLEPLPPGAWIHFTDWRGDPDERLGGEGTEIARLLARLAGRGVDVRGLVWRSHTDRAHFSEEENLHLVETVNDAGGEVLLDERVRRDGSHHQKLFVIHHPATPHRDVAFVGGIDLCHGRRDDADHNGDEQAIELDARYGPRPPWHDIQLEVRGPAVGDLAWTFRERWEDPTPLDHRNPWRAQLRRLAGEPRRPDPLPPAPADPPPVGVHDHAVQVLRTYPAKRPALPFAPDGERSVARAYLKAFERARRLVYVEDQYLWSSAAATFLGARLRAEPSLHLVAVVPRYPDQDGRLSGPPYRIGQQRAIDELRRAGGDRVAIFDLEAPSGWPIYVHAKICVVDDTWMIVGSDNLNLRSWTNDSEVSCAVIDHRRDDREPIDPGGHGDGARVLARETRIALWREHLGWGDDAIDDHLADGVAAIDVLRRSAATLDAWHAGPQTSERPPGRLGMHQPGRVRWWAAWWARPVHHLLIDPDGRPRHMRRSDSF